MAISAPTHTLDRDVEAVRHAGTSSKRLNIELWSYNFDPEPTGIGIVSTVWARGLRDRGHHIDVVAAHPHYPEPQWGTRLLPYREVRDGIDVLRLPLWIGRESTAARLRQEMTFTAAQTVAAPFLSRPDVLVSVSPSFPALLPALMRVRSRRIPWVLWLHDLLPDGAMATGLVDDNGTVIKLSRQLERAAYKAADRIIVLSSAFVENLVAKGVPEEKIKLIYDPATRVPRRRPKPRSYDGPLRVLSMGNIGHSQGLTEVVQAFESHPDLDAQLVITGTGVAAGEAQAQMKTDRVWMLGVVSDVCLERELAGADIGLVTQCYEGSEFNIPSKLMNYLAYGLPVLAAVNPGGEVARIVRARGAGWVVDSSDADALPRELARLRHARDEIKERASRAREYAEDHFMQAGFAKQFEETLLDVARPRRRIKQSRRIELSPDYVF